MRRWLSCLLLAGLAAGAALPARAQHASFGPLLPAERASTESPRSVPAAEYRDAYCARWSDGCTVCQRTHANDQPSCQPFTSPGPLPDASCQRRPVQCQATLKSIHRVCFSWTDGCNRCIGGVCTLAACPSRPADYQCRSLRTARFTPGDIMGHWRLTTPGGESCELALHGHVTLTASCLPLGEPVTRLSQAKFDADELRLLGRDGAQLLAFDTENPDDLQGRGSSGGYRLVRLEPTPFEPLMWEGRWELRNRHNSSTCQFVLSMRNRKVEGQINFVRVPHGITFTAFCVSEANDGMFREPLTASLASRITRTDGGRQTTIVRSTPNPLPLWTSWRTEVSDLVFRDEFGRETVFKIQEDLSWRTQIEFGDKSLVLTLQHKRD